MLHPFATVGHPLFAHDGTLVAVLGLITDQRSSAQTLLGFVRIAELSDRDEFVRVAGAGRLYASDAPEQHRRRPDGAGLSARRTSSRSTSKAGSSARRALGLNLLRAERHEDILFRKSRDDPRRSRSTNWRPARPRRTDRDRDCRAGWRLRRPSSSSDSRAERMRRGRAGALAAKEARIQRRRGGSCHVCRMVGRGALARRRSRSAPCKKPSICKSRRYRC